jgi:hypothetical protein
MWVIFYYCLTGFTTIIYIDYVSVYINIFLTFDALCFLFFSSPFGFASSNEHTTSWEAMTMRKCEEELFYLIKANIQWSEKKLEKIKHLIHHPLFNVNRVYHTENITETLLHCAIRAKQFKLALCLVEKGADLTLQDTQGHTPLQRLLDVKSDITPALNALKDVLKREDYISHLPTELLINIFDRLPLESLENASKVSRRFNNIIQDILMTYLYSNYQDLMRDYIKRLRKDNRDEVQVEQKTGRYLRKVIKEAPYTVKLAYFEFLFQKKYIEWGWHCTLFRERLLFALNEPELWNRFIEICSQLATDERTVAGIVLDSTSHIDEEVALTCLRHTEFRKFVLEDNTESTEWLLDIFQDSIEYELYDADSQKKPITYELVGASRLSAALFILDDKDYREKLEKGLREDQGELEIILRRLHFIMSDHVDPPHRGEAEAQKNAKSISEQLEPLIVPEISRTLMPAPSQQL